MAEAKQYLEAERVEHIVQQHIMGLSTRMLKCFKLVFDRFEKQDKLLESMNDCLHNALNISIGENAFNNEVSNGCNVIDYDDDDEYNASQLINDSHVRSPVEMRGQSPSYYSRLIINGENGDSRSPQSEGTVLDQANQILNQVDYKMTNGFGSSPNSQEASSANSSYAVLPESSYAAAVHLTNTLSTKPLKTRAHDPMLICPFCDTPSYRSNLRRHVRLHHERSHNPVKCPVCQHCCVAGWPDLKSHVATVHPSEDLSTMHRSRATILSKEEAAQKRAKKFLPTFLRSEPVPMTSLPVTVNNTPGMTNGITVLIKHEPLDVPTSDIDDSRSNSSSLQAFPGICVEGEQFE